MQEPINPNYDEVTILEMKLEVKITSGCESPSSAGKHMDTDHGIITNHHWGTTAFLGVKKS